MNQKMKIVIGTLLILVISALAALLMQARHHDKSTPDAPNRKANPAVTFPFEGKDCTSTNQNGSFDRCLVESNDMFRIYKNTYSPLPKDECGNLRGKTENRTITVNSSGEYIVEDAISIYTTLIFCERNPDAIDEVDLEGQPKETTFKGKVPPA